MVKQEFEERLGSWIQLNHPAHVKRVTTPELRDVMALMATGVDSKIAPSQAALTGPGKDDSLANPDWATNPALGAANVANMARNAAGYNPADLSNAGASSAQYQAFVAKLVSCPLYTVMMSDTQSITKTSSDWNTMIDGIADTFEGIAQEDKDSIVAGLKNLAQAASSKMSTTQTEAVFVQNVVNVDDVISYYLYSTQTNFIETQGKGYDTKQSTFNVLRLRLQFQTDLWPMYWQQIKNAFDGSIVGWIGDNSSSTAGTQPIPALK